MDARRATTATAAAGIALLLALSMSAQQEEDVPLHYEVRGRGPAVVLIHGGVMDLGMWDEQVAALAGEHRVVRLDIRGFGDSPPPEGPFSPAADVARVLDELEIERADVVGTSLGGAIAIDFALSRPERVRSLVLAEPGVAGWPYSAEVVASMAPVAAALGAGDREGAVQALLRTPAFEYARDHNAAAIARIEGLVRSNLGGLVAQRQIRFERPDAVEALSTLRMPTLLMVSAAAGSDASRIAARIEADAPRVRRVVVEESGHLMNIERPEAFNAAVIEFLRRGS